jgi:MFS family permease
VSRLQLAIRDVFSSDIDKRNEWVYYLTQICHSLVFTIPIWILYYQMRVSVAQLSVLVTVQYIAQIALELLSGALADLIGRRSTIWMGFLFGAFAYLLFPLSTNFWQVLILVVLIGVADSFRSGSEEALVYDTFKQVGQEKKFGKVYANGNVIYQGGLITATALGGILFSFYQHLPYIMYGIFLLLGTVLAYWYIEPTIDSTTFSLRNYLDQIRQGSKEAFKNLYTKYLSLYYVFVGGITWAGTLFFNEYMMLELGFSDSLRGVLTATMRFLNVVIISTVLKNEKIFTWKRTIYFFPIIMMLGFLPGQWLHGFAGLPFVQAAMIATTARWIILSPLTNEAFSSKYRATAISFLSLLIGVVYIGLTSVSTYVIPYLGIKTMYSLIGIISAVTVIPLAVKLAKTQSGEGLH